MVNIINATIEFSETDIDSIFGAIAHPIRRQIIEILTFQSLEVKELDKKFNVSKPALVKHLDILEKAGIILRQRDKRRSVCILKAESLKEIKEYIDFYSTFWK